MLRIALRRLSFFPFDEDRISDSRRSFHSYSRRKPKMIDIAVDKFYAALGGMPNLEALLATGDHVIGVIADAICQIGFWDPKTQIVLTPPSGPPRN